MLEATYWTEVTKELDEQCSNEWKDASEPIALSMKKCGIETKDIKTNIHGHPGRKNQIK